MLENTYLDTVAEQNASLTKKKPAKNIIGANITSRAELDELAKREISRNAAQTIYITGKSKSYQTTIGCLVTIQMPENLSKTRSLGTYRVVKSICQQRTRRTRKQPYKDYHYPKPTYPRV